MYGVWIYEFADRVWKFWTQTVIVYIKLFAFDLLENIGTQAIFMVAALWITMSFLQIALFKRENCLASDVCRQLKRKEL